MGMLDLLAVKLEPFSLTILVTNGDPEGLLVIERSNWSGKILVFPRTIVPEIIKTRDEMNFAGVYVLIGHDEAELTQKIYIGEGETVGSRLQDHFRKKDFWTKAVVFTSNQGHLNKAHVKYLEFRLIELAKKANRADLENSNRPKNTRLSETDRLTMDAYLEHLLKIIPILGIHAFKVVQSGKPQHRDLLTCEGRGVKAMGFDSTDGFVVLKGSEAVLNVTDAFAKNNSNNIRLRRELIQKGVLQLKNDCYVFTQDYIFRSPSLASGIVLGRSSNGRIEWKDDEGKTLKEIQELQLAPFE